MPSPELDAGQEVTPPLPLRLERATLGGIVSGAAERIVGGAKLLLVAVARLLVFVPKAYAPRSSGPVPPWVDPESPLKENRRGQALVFTLRVKSKGSALVLTLSSALDSRSM